MVKLRFHYRTVLVCILGLFFGMHTGFSQTRSDFLIAEDIIAPPGIVQDSMGQIHMVWGIAPDTTNAWYLVYSRFDSLLNPLGAPTLLSNTTGCAEPDVQVRDSVVVLTYREIRLARFTDFIWAELWDINGHRRYDPFMLNGEYHDANRFSPHAVFINDSTLQTAWSGQGPWPSPYTGFSGVFGRSLTTHGVLGNSILILSDLPFYNQQDLFGSQLVEFPHDSTFLAVWWDKRTGKPAYYARLFTNAGTPLGASFPVSEDTSTLNLYYYDVAQDPAGNAVVVWSAMRPDSTWDIRWRWLNGQGEFLSPTEQVSPENAPVAGQASVSIAIDAQGRSIVCWEESHQDQSWIYAQRFSADHQRLGPAFRVSQRTNVGYYGQIYPIVFQRHGQVYVIWTETTAATIQQLWGTIFPFDDPPDEILHDTPSIPTQLVLAPAYPNPFNSTTQITYRLAQSSRVRISVYNLLGQEVRKVEDRVQLAGRYQCHWDGTAQDGSAVSSGLYVIRLQSGVQIVQQKVLLLR